MATYEEPMKNGTNGAGDHVTTEYVHSAKGEFDAATSQHVLGQDNPWEVGFQLASAVDNAFILGYALLILDFLGWVAGSICFIGGALVSLYANILLAKLAVIKGVRYYRFRDITASVWGPFGWWLTIILQWTNVIGGNIGLAILAGQALKGVHDQYDFSNQSIKLPEWIIITGGVLIVMAIIIPDLHYLRYMAILAASCSVCFCFIVIGIASRDGAQAPPRSYNTGLGETTATKTFNIMGAIASIAFAYSTVIIPEIQATIRDPPVENFIYKSLVVTYGCGAPIFIVMSYVGFWAYGSNVYPNLISNLSNPQWAITVAWIAVFIQSVVSLQIYSAPIYETIDTAFMRSGGPWLPYNVVLRVLWRVPYIVLTCFFAALLPFFGDFIALIGSLSVLPLNFSVTFLLHAQVNKDHISSLSYYGHYLLGAIFAVLTVACSVASIRYIVEDSINYSVFANQGA